MDPKGSHRLKLILFSTLPSVTPDSTNCCGSLRGLQDKCICSASPTTAYIPLRRLPHPHIYCFCRFDACELFHGFLPFRISIVLLLFSYFSKFLRRHRAKILGHDEDWRNLEGSKSVRVRQSNQRISISKHLTECSLSNHLFIKHCSYLFCHTHTKKKKPNSRFKASVP